MFLNFQDKPEQSTEQAPPPQAQALLYYIPSQQIFTPDWALPTCEPVHQKLVVDKRSTVWLEAIFRLKIYMTARNEAAEQLRL